MADVGLQSIDGQDHAPLLGQLGDTFRQCFQRQAQQEIVLGQQIAHRTQRDRYAFLLQLGVNFRAGAMLAVAQLPHTYQDVQSEFLSRKRPLSLFFRMLGTMKTGAVGMLTPANVQMQAHQATSCHELAFLGIGHRHRLPTGEANGSASGQPVLFGRLSSGRIPRHDFFPSI